MLKVGEVIDGKYKILSKIGSGGMSVVYLALNERANKSWAIKEVKKKATTDARLVKQSLIVETNLLKKLSHPYLPSIVDVIDRDDSFLIVMDYIEGNTLSKALEEHGALPQEYVIEWGKELCDVLEYLHNRKPPIIYRDLKPSNIMLKPNGTITLIDFGTAREYKKDGYNDTTCLGTKGYAAPEQFGGMGQTDARTDIYCLGTTMYHLLTGHNPCEPPYELYPIRYWDSKLSSGLEKIIEKCTKNNPDERYSSCAEVYYDLCHFDELDKSYRRTAKIKIFAFAMLLICCVLSFLIAGISKVTASNIGDENYETFIEEAAYQADEESSANMYMAAIELNPTDEEAYLNLLENVYLADGNLSASEDEELRALLITKYDDNNTYEQKLMENEAGYDLFAYKMGLAYFYSYDEDGNKTMSQKWFNIAASSDTLSEAQLVRAEKFGSIASYYLNLEKENKSGDSVVGYKNYFEDLAYVADGDIAEIDNSTTALIIYRETAAQIFQYVVNFKNDGISYDDMKAVLDNITDRLGTDIETSDAVNTDRINELIEQTKSNVENAMYSLNVAFEK